MGTNSKGSGIIATKAAPREPIPAGNHMARCYMMLLIGTVEDEFKGVFKSQVKVRIGWELPHEMRVFKEGDDPKPCAISEEFTLSTGPKANLRKMIDSWRGKSLTEKEADAFDITKLLGVACMLNIIHVNGKGDNASKVYEKIASIAPMAKGTLCPEPINEKRVFNYADKFDASFVETLPDFIKKRIKSSEEWMAKVAAGEIGEVEESHEEEDVANVDLALNSPAVADDLPF